MKPIATFKVRPSLPDPLKPLLQIAYNLRWSWDHAAIDLFLATAAQGRGLGPEAVRLIATWLVDVRGHHRLTIDPAAHNVAAIRAYRKVGFSPVGTLRAYERGPEGEWHDGLLMEMLAGDLVRRG